MIEVRYNKEIHTRMGIVMKKKNVFLWTILTGIVITIILIVIDSPLVLRYTILYRIVYLKSC